MSDLDLIRKLENVIGFNLMQESLDEFYRNRQDYIKLKRSYVLSENKEVIALGLDDISQYILSRIDLFEYKKLTCLRLRRNNLIDVSFLKELKELTNLDLSYNQQIRDFSFLKELKRLTNLDLSYNNLNDVSFLKELTGLTNLYLHSNNLSDVSFLKELKGLTNLYIRSNNLSDVSFLKELKGLTNLYLSYNNLSDVSFLKELKGLTNLYLSSNNLSNVSFLSELKGLTNLDLSYNKQIKDFSFLKELKGLTNLYLNWNKEIKDFSFLKELTALTNLDLSWNQLSDVSFLKEIPGLTKLFLRKNDLSDVSFLKELKRLTILDLRDNHLSDVSFLQEMEMLTYVKLIGNPLEIPPKEIAEQGIEAIRNFFRQQKEQGTDYLYEAKLLVLGEGGAGKTTMVRKLENPECSLPSENETTRGIEIIKIYFKYYLDNQKPKNFCINIWDFGGQDIYKSTHRFFLSERTLYIILADTRKEDTDFFYWLHITELFGGESPVLVVINEKFDRKRSFDYSQLRGRFDNLKEKLEVNFSDNRGLDELRNNIEQYISRLSIVREPLPAGWIRVKERIENIGKKYISFEEFKSIGNENKIISIDDLLLLSKHFHDLGIFLHFQDDNILQETIFLKTDWVTNTVYTIIDNPLLYEKNGHFTKQDAEKILNEFSRMHGKFLQLMKKFLLIYEIDETQTYISPYHLSENQPATGSFSNFIYIRYEYKEFMPKGIVNQFTVLMHDKIESVNSVWKNGVILKWENTRAEIIEYYGSKEIKIKVEGERKRDFMTLIIETLDKINYKYKKLKVDKYIPCNCENCRKSENPYEYPYKTLIHYIINKEPEIKCDKSFKMVNVLNLVDDIMDKQEFEKDERKLSVTESLNSNNVVDKYKRKSELQQMLLDKQQELKKETAKKDLLDKEANKKAGKLVWVYIVFGIVVFVLTYFLIQEFKWDIAKRIEYLISFIIGIITIVLSYIFGYKLTPENIREQRLEKFKREIYTRNKFDLKEYTELEKEIDELKVEIRKLE